MIAMTWVLLAVGLAAPLVLLLVGYDLRWIRRSLQAGRLPPWGACARLAAAGLCHGGAALLITKGQVWPAKQMTFWLHMTFDPGLTCYAFGLWDLFTRLSRRASPTA